MGQWQTSTSIGGFVGANDLHDGNTGKGAKSATFGIGALLLDGYHAECARWTSHANRASNAPYTVHHAGGSVTTRLNQRLNGGEWVLIGTSAFDGLARVVLSTEGTDGYVIGDGVRFVQVV